MLRLGQHQGSARTASGHRQDGARTPPGHRQDTARTPPGRRQDTATTPPGHCQDAARTPPGHRQDTARTTLALGAVFCKAQAKSGSWDFSRARPAPGKTYCGPHPGAAIYDFRPRRGRGLHIHDYVHVPTHGAAGHAGHPTCWPWVCHLRVLPQLAPSLRRHQKLLRVPAQGIARGALNVQLCFSRPSPPPSPSLSFLPRPAQRTFFSWAAHDSCGTAAKPTLSDTHLPSARALDLGDVSLSSTRRAS